MPTIIDRTIAVLEKIQFEEAQEILNELRQVKMQSVHKATIAQIRVNILKSAIGGTAKACQALDGLEEADQILELTSLLLREQAEQARET